MASLSVGVEAPRFKVDRLVLMAHAYLLMLLAAAGTIYHLLELSPERFVYPLCLFYPALLIWLFWSWKQVTGHLVDLYSIFLTAASLFNGAQILLEVAGLNGNGILEDRFTPETLLGTIFLVEFGLASLHLGALLALRRNQDSSLTSLPDEATAQIQEQSARLVGMALLAVAIVPEVYIMWSAITDVMAQGYFILYQREDAVGIQSAPRVLAGLFVPGLLMLLAGSRRLRGASVTAAALLVLYSFVNFFLGTRAAAATALIALTWLWHQQIRPIPRLLVLLGSGFFLGFVFPLVATIRNISGEYRSSLSFLWESFTSLQNPAIMIFREIGYTMTTVAYSVDLVPNLRPFDHGVSYFYAATASVPQSLLGYPSSYRPRKPRDLVDLDSRSRDRSQRWGFGVFLPRRSVREFWVVWISPGSSRHWLWDLVPRQQS